MYYEPTIAVQTALTQCYNGTHDLAKLSHSTATMHLIRFQDVSTSHSKYRITDSAQ